MISTWGYHLGEVWGLALSFDASYVVTAGADKALRIWKRTKEQMFLDEERDKEMEEQFEQDAVRDDKDVNDVVAVRPTRRTIESVRTTEKLMEVLDEAEKEDICVQMGCTPLGHGLRCIQTMKATDIYEVLLALPFNYALKFLEFIATFLQKGGIDSTYRDELLCCELETACRAALITIHVHHRQLASHTDLLLRLRDHLRGVASTQRDFCGLNIAAMAQFGIEAKQDKIVFDENPAKRPKLDELY
jgi:U3 small nucleolar RNA-associated protein 12